MLKFAVAIHQGSNHSCSPLRVTFDAAFSVLDCLPRMFIEPDGSFVWTGTTVDGERWQVDGNLIDRGDVLAYVELKGCCPEMEFDRLLSALGWPEAPVVFALMQRGLTLDEAAFRRLAASEKGAI